MKQLKYGLTLVAAAAFAVGCGGGGGLFGGGGNVDQFRGDWAGVLRVDGFGSEQWELNIRSDGRITGRETFDQDIYNLDGDVNGNGDFIIRSRFPGGPVEVTYDGDMNRNSNNRLTGNGVAIDSEGNRRNFNFDLDRGFFGPEKVIPTDSTRKSAEGTARFSK